MFFIWQLGSNLTLNHENNVRIVFFDPKKIKKYITFNYLAKIIFFKMVAVAILD